MNNALLTLKKTFTGNIHMMFWLEQVQKQPDRSSFCPHSAKYTKRVHLKLDSLKHRLLIGARKILKMLQSVTFLIKEATHPVMDYQ